MDVNETRLRIIGSLSILTKPLQILLEKITMEMTGMPCGNDAVSYLLQHSPVNNIKTIPALNYAANKPMWYDTTLKKKKPNIMVDTSTFDVTLINHILVNVLKLYNTLPVPLPNPVNHVNTCTIHVLSNSPSAIPCKVCEDMKKFLSCISDLRNISGHNIVNKMYEDFETGQVQILGCQNGSQLWQKIETMHTYCVDFLTDSHKLVNVITQIEQTDLYRDLYNTLYQGIAYVKRVHQKAITDLVNSIVDDMKMTKGRFRLEFNVNFEFVEEVIKEIDGMIVLDIYKPKSLKTKDVGTNSKLSEIILNAISEKLANIVGQHEYTNYCDISQKQARVATASSSSKTENNAANFQIIFKAEPDTMPYSYNKASSKETMQLTDDIQRQVERDVYNELNIPVEAVVTGWTLGSIIIAVNICKLSNESWTKNELLKLLRVIYNTIQNMQVKNLRLVDVTMKEKEEYPKSDFTYKYRLTSTKAALRQQIEKNIKSLKYITVDGNISVSDAFVTENYDEFADFIVKVKQSISRGSKDVKDAQENLQPQITEVMGSHPKTPEEVKEPGNNIPAITQKDDVIIDLPTISSQATDMMDKGIYVVARLLYQIIYEKLAKVHGESHHDTSTANYNIATCFMAEGRYKDARLIFSTIYENHRYTLGEQHADTLRTRYNIASCMVKEELYSEAKLIFKSIYEEQVISHGVLHPEVLVTKHNMAACMVHEGLFHDAKVIFEDVYNNQLVLLGDSHPSALDTKSNIAVCMVEEGNYNNAKLIFQDIYEIQKNDLGAQHPTTLATLHNITFCMEEQTSCRKSI